MVRKENGRYREATKSEIFEAARVKLEHIFSRESELLESPDGVKDWLRIRLAHKSHEVFGVLWLDNRQRAITFNEISHGTIDSATVSPREVVRGVLLKPMLPPAFYVTTTRVVWRHQAKPTNKSPNR